MPTKVVPSKSKKNAFYHYLYITLIFMSCLFLGIILFIDLLPKDYFYFLVGIFITVDSGLIILMNGKKKIKLIGQIVSFILIVLLILITTYEINTISFLKKLGYHNYTTATYKVIVKADSKYQNLITLNKEIIAVVDNQTTSNKKAISYLNKKIIFEKRIKGDYLSAVDSLMNSGCQAALITEEQLAAFEKDKIINSYDYRIVASFTIEFKN